MIDYKSDLTVLQSIHPILADEIAGFRTLEHILDWMKEKAHSLASMDMVTQDEYSHDLMIPIGSDWLVFGAT